MPNLITVHSGNFFGDIFKGEMSLLFTLLMLFRTLRGAGGCAGRGSGLHICPTTSG